LAAGVAILAVGAAAVLFHVSDPPWLWAGAALAGATGLAGAVLGSALERAAQIRRENAALALLATTVRSILEDGASKARRKPLEIRLMRFDGRLLRDRDRASDRHGLLAQPAQADAARLPNLDY
jgi:hypothetical protein